MRLYKSVSPEIEKFRSSVIDKVMADIVMSAVSLMVAENALTDIDIDRVIAEISLEIRKKVSNASVQSSNEVGESKDSKKN